MLINVESGPALAALPSLLAVPGLDGVFIGPHDLSVQLGVPEAWGHEVLRTLTRAHTRACTRARALLLLYLQLSVVFLPFALLLCRVSGSHAGCWGLGLRRKEVAY